MAAAYPPWVIFGHVCTEVQGCSSSVADTNTTARCRTSTGRPIDVSLCLAAPPEWSRVCVQPPDGIAASYVAKVVAAHGDSVLVEAYILGKTDSIDCFVYSAGDASAEPPRPPSLSLLPPHRIAYEDDGRRPGGCNYLDIKRTGLLRRRGEGEGEGEFLVAELKIEYEYVKEKDGTVHTEAALHLLRSGSCEWRVKRPVISGYAAAGDQCLDDLALLSWRICQVIPVGDQMLCWVDLERGLLVSDDVFGESPSLRYVPLPENFVEGSVRVTGAGDGSTIKFVNVFPRCCCGAPTNSDCTASHHAYAVHTWTLRMDDDDMTWAMDGSLDATQLWALDGYKGLPRVQLDMPVVSMDEPDSICFVVCDENHHEKDVDETAWRIMVDMKSKTLGSVDEGRGWPRSYNRPLPSRVSRYFNSESSSDQLLPAGPAAQAEAMLNMANRRINNELQPINSTTILTALQEIPRLDRDDMLKAYRILTHDDSGRRFRALMGLPMDLKKDYVLMEIKASEACLLCSACSADLQIKE